MIYLRFEVADLVFERFVQRYVTTVFFIYELPSYVRVLLLDRGQCWKCYAQYCRCMCHCYTHKHYYCCYMSCLSRRGDFFFVGAHSQKISASRRNLSLWKRSGFYFFGVCEPTYWRVSPEAKKREIIANAKEPVIRREKKRTSSSSVCLSVRT